MRAPVNSGVTDIVLVFLLPGSPEPFYCYSCCQRKYAAAIEELTAAVTSLAAERGLLNSEAMQQEQKIRLQCLLIIS